MSEKTMSKSEETRGGDHVTTYFVDNEPQKTTERELTVRTILKNAGFDPDQHYLVELHGDKQVPHRDLSEVLKVHENEKFVAIFTGPTPVSSEGLSCLPSS